MNLQAVDVEVDQLVDAAIVTPPQVNANLLDDSEPYSCPPLPSYARVDQGMAVSASPWLDEYISYSRRRSPRAYDGFHEANGLWALSTVAAGRPVSYLGHSRYPSLYIAQVARTSVYAKSTTTRVGLDVLRAAGLDYLLMPDTMTPQMFISQMVPQLPTDFDQLPAERKEWLVNQACFSGQRGWFYEEFGQKLTAMMREGGIMSDFHSILRRLDDHNPTFEYATISRGREVVTRPYLSLLANLTPADLKPYARPGGALWQDGFFARFALVVPPPSSQLNVGRFPRGTTSIPGTLLTPLVTWNKRLGRPAFQMGDATDRKGGTAGRHVLVGPLPCHECMLAEDVEDAFYAYHDGLVAIANHSSSNDLDGNYARFADKAIRIAMLFASLELDGKINMHHWARAQLITERWRAGLHHLVESLNDAEASGGELKEDKVLSLMQRATEKEKWWTARELAQRIRGMSSRDVEQVLEPLARSGEVDKANIGKTLKFRLTAMEK